MVHWRGSITAAERKKLNKPLNLCQGLKAKACGGGEWLKYDGEAVMDSDSPHIKLFEPRKALAYSPIWHVRKVRQVLPPCCCQASADIKYSEHMKVYFTYNCRYENSWANFSFSVFFLLFFFFMRLLCISALLLLVHSEVNTLAFMS